MPGVAMVNAIWVTGGSDDVAARIKNRKGMTAF
jgi:hypothetical protein